MFQMPLISWISAFTLLFYLYITITCALVNNQLYVRNRHFDRKTCRPGDHVKQFDNIRNGLACVVRCVEYKCMDVFYNSDTKICAGCYTFHSSDLQPSNQNGEWLSYQSVLECPLSYVRHNTSCYKVTTSQMSWKSAKGRCVSDNAYLAIIDGVLENNFIANLLDTVGLSDERVYIGLSASKKKNKWLTVNGNTQVYFNWEDGQPSNGWIGLGLIDEDCVVMKSKRWRDMPCGNSYFAVCEMELI